MKKSTKTVSKKDLLKRLKDNKKLVFVPEWGENVEIRLMSFKEMIELSQLPEEEKQAQLIASSLEIDLKEAEEIVKNSNGLEFGPLYRAVNSAYSIKDDEVKKP